MRSRFIDGFILIAPGVTSSGNKLLSRIAQGNRACQGNFGKNSRKIRKTTELVSSVVFHAQIPRCAVCSFVLNLLTQVGILSSSPALLKRPPLSTTSAAIAFPGECPIPYI
jgi:hypothetical protein